MCETLNSRTGFFLQNKSMLPDGTIEVTDTLPKPDYYKSLRRNSGSAPISQFPINNSINVYDASIGQRKSKPIDYKPSGKHVQCSVLLLEGVEHMHKIDRNSYGIHLFKEVCEKLELTETEYCGLTYRGNQHVDMWLRLDEKIAKQLDRNPWKFEFRFKFYPANPLDLKDDLTRYFLCLQIRQDLICGQLPCSFNTYVILGAHVIQSEAGDWDPKAHEGIEYLANTPFAPQALQTPEMLVRITELHQKLKGRTPEQADRLFLENSRRLALYGVHLHRVKGLSGEDLSLGVYHAGVLIYRGRLRMRRYTWARIVELSYKGKDFIMVVRPVIFDEYVKLPGGSIGTQRRTSVTSTLEGSASKNRSRSAKPSQTWRNITLTFKCRNSELAKRLFNVVTDHHAFFRLRDQSEPRRHNLQPGFGTRKYHYSSRPQVFDDSESVLMATNKEESLLHASSIRRVAAQRKPEEYARSLVTLMTPVVSRKGPNFRAPCASLEDADSIRNGFLTSGANLGPHESSVLMEESYAPVRFTQNANNLWTQPPIDQERREPQQSIPLSISLPKANRPELSKEHWQMSPADCTEGLGMDRYGTDVATMIDAGWQGSRTNKGIKGPGSFYFEVTVIEDGAIRVGWSTNEATLMLGMDAKGYGYGADESGDGSYMMHSPTGRLVHNAESHKMGRPAVLSDVIGCFLQLQEEDTGGDKLVGNIMWSHNGLLVTSPNANLVRIPQYLASGNAFFPTISLRDARVFLNFGEKPFTHSPEILSGGRVQWLAPVQVPPEQTVKNANSGWRINPHDTTSATQLVVSEDGRRIQTKEDSKEWHGFRANKGVYKAGKYYYEIEMVEDSGCFRVGWCLPKADLHLGMDNLGYGFGMAPDGSPAKKIYNGEIENYGPPIRVGDVVGCFLDLDNGIIQWSVNGESLPPAWHVNSSFINHPKSVFFPAASLLGTTLEVNYGDRPFKFQTSEEWYPLFAATDQYVQGSPKSQTNIPFGSRSPISTERSESDIELSVVMIKVKDQEPARGLHSQPPPPPPPVNHRSCNHRDEENEEAEDEDTVVYTKSKSEGLKHQPLNTFSNNTTTSSTKIEENDPGVTVEYYMNDKDQRVKRTIQKHRKVVTTIHNESVERFETTRVYQRSRDGSVTEVLPNNGPSDDAELCRAIHETTKLDVDTRVVNDSTNGVRHSEAIPTLRPANT